MFVPKQDVIFLEMAVEDAIKMVVSLGVVVPQPLDAGGLVAASLPASAVAKD